MHVDYNRTQKEAHDVDSGGESRAGQHAGPGSGQLNILYYVILYYIKTYFYISNIK